MYNTSFVEYNERLIVVYPFSIVKQCEFCNSGSISGCDILSKLFAENGSLNSHYYSNFIVASDINVDAGRALPCI